jgi:hypothetical protein
MRHVPKQSFDGTEDLMQQTERDAQIVEWLGRIGGASAEHLMQQFGMSQSVTSRRMCALVADGLVGYRRILHLRPGLYWALREGLRWRGLTRTPVFKVSPATYEHTWQTATAAVALHRALPGWRAIYEREIIRLETDEGKLIASVEVGGNAQSILHRPDLLLVAPIGRVVAVEVELTDKGPRRLEQICRGWRRARHIDHVYYLAQPRAGRTMKRTVQRVRGEDMITVLALDDIAGIVERELAPRPSPDSAPQAFADEADEGLELWPWERELTSQINPAPYAAAGEPDDGLDLWPWEEE